MPKPLNDSVRDRMRFQKVRDTKAEMAIRRLVHAAGLRYRVDHRPEPDLRVRADLVFRRRRVAVFIDGCFWHGCPEHFVPPKNNASWWANKIEANRARDSVTDEMLRGREWMVLRFWEHEESASVARAIILQLTCHA